MKKKKYETEDRGLYAHIDRGYGKRGGEGYGPGAYGYEGSGTRRINPTVEDDYSDSYGYGSRFGESPIAHHGLGWADERSDTSSVGGDFRIGDETAMRGHPDLGHHGKGPKNWKRSDELIHDQVCERLMRAPHVDASDIEVSVADGVVTLAGSVTDDQALKDAENVAAHVPGVEEVVNHLITP